MNFRPSIYFIAVILFLGMLLPAQSFARGTGAMPSDEQVTITISGAEECPTDAEGCPIEDHSNEHSMGGGNENTPLSGVGAAKFQWNQLCNLLGRGENGQACALIMSCVQYVAGDGQKCDAMECVNAIRSVNLRDISNSADDLLADCEAFCQFDPSNKVCAALMCVKNPGRACCELFADYIPACCQLFYLLDAILICKRNPSVQCCEIIGAAKDALQASNVGLNIDMGRIEEICSALVNCSTDIQADPNHLPSVQCCKIAPQEWQDECMTVLGCYPVVDGGASEQEIATCCAYLSQTDLNINAYDDLSNEEQAALHTLVATKFACKAYRCIKDKTLECCRVLQQGIAAFGVEDRIPSWVDDVLNNCDAIVSCGSRIMDAAKSFRKNNGDGFAEWQATVDASLDSINEIGGCCEDMPDPIKECQLWECNNNPTYSCCLKYPGLPSCIALLRCLVKPTYGRDPEDRGADGAISNCCATYQGKLPSCAYLACKEDPKTNWRECCSLIPAAEDIAKRLNISEEELFPDGTNNLCRAAFQCLRKPGPECCELVLDSDFPVETCKQVYKCVNTGLTQGISKMGYQCCKVISTLKLEDWSNGVFNGDNLDEIEEICQNIVSCVRKPGYSCCDALAGAEGILDPTDQDEDRIFKECRSFMDCLNGNVTVDCCMKYPYAYDDPNWNPGDPMSEHKCAKVLKCQVLPTSCCCDDPALADVNIPACNKRTQCRNHPDLECCSIYATTEVLTDCAQDGLIGQMGSCFQCNKHSDNFDLEACCNNIGKGLVEGGVVKIRPAPICDALAKCITAPNKQCCKALKKAYNEVADESIEKAERSARINDVCSIFDKFLINKFVPNLVCDPPPADLYPPGFM